VKLKTLTFMAAGVPVVGTPGAVEGIDGQHGRHFLVAEEPVGLAEGIRRVVSDPELARRLGAGGRELVSERYSWPAVGARFRADVERAVAAADGGPRKQSPTGPFSA
jgi:glycosyltransferase involved in cell wall biosynthesis